MHTTPDDIYQAIMARWYADGAEVSLRRISEQMAELRTALTGLVAQLPQPNLDDPDLDAAIDFANATLAKIV